jgi:hypothetical protein
MPAPLLRKKPDKGVTYDPVSAEAWAAGATATAAVVDLLDLLRLNPTHAATAALLTQQLDAAAALTPCALKKDGRTQPRQKWSFQDYLLTVGLCASLRSIVVDGVDCVPRGTFAPFDATRERAAQAVIAFVDKIDNYATLVKRERAYERLSGNQSLRRGL